MEKELEDMPKALRLLADKIHAPDHVPAMCMRDAAEIIEMLVKQRDESRRLIQSYANYLEAVAEADAVGAGDDNCSVKRAEIILKEIQEILEK